MPRNVTYVKPQEPSFLKAFKAKVGYREPTSVDAKREVPSRPDDGDEVERDGEQPTVVVLREGDLGQDEYEAMCRKSKASNKEDNGNKGALKPDCDIGIPTVPVRPQETTDDDEDEERIKFRKPTKRRSCDGGSGGVLDASTSKKTRMDKSQKVGAATTMVVGGVKRRSSSGGENKSRKIKNNSLLSFGGGDDEDDS